MNLHTRELKFERLTAWWGRLFFSIFVVVGVVFTANAQTGEVRAAGQAIPGATVTAQQDGKKLVTTTDENGRYVLEGMTPGAWTVQVEMFGFVTAKREVQIGATPVNSQWNLELKAATPPLSTQAGARGQARGQRGSGFQSLGSQMENQIEAAIAANSPTEVPSGATSENANESFLINGSLTGGLQNTGAPTFGDQFGGRDGFARGMGADGAPPPGMGSTTGGGFGGQGGGPGGGGFGGGGFGGGRGGGGFGGGFGGGGYRMRGNRGGRGPEFFGNRANRARDQIHGMLSFTISNSVANARPFSLTGQDVPEPSYAQTRYSLILGGPLIIPKIVKSPNTFFSVTYFGTRARNPQKFVTTVPTAVERAGDFSQTGAAIYDVFTGVPFAGNIIPPSRFSPIALGLMNYLPLPNQPGIVQNYQFLTASAQNTDNLGVHLNQNLTKRDRLGLNFQFQRRDGNNAQTYSYSDTKDGLGVNVGLTYTRNIGARAINVAQAQFNRNTNRTMPFFADKIDVAQQLGIQGASPNPVNWGPPTLSFTNFGSLSDATYSLMRNQAMGGTDAYQVPIGKHNLSFGGNFTRSQLNNLTDQNGRGSFTFTGLSTSALDANGNPLSGTGLDFADFLLGLPDASSIRYGTSSTYFRGSVMGAFGQDDWRVLPNVSLNFGLRYEYITPLTEKYGHIANLDIAPYFSGVAPVIPGQSGPYTGAFPSSLIDPDRHDWAPRVALAWKPNAKKSLQIRTGYGVYYVPNTYNQFMSLFASQPPWANTNTITTSVLDPLTLSSGLSFTVPGKTVTNTFAVNRYYLVPYAQTWNFSIQQDLPAAMVLEVTYRGTKGTRLPVERNPNTSPPGSPLTSEQQRLVSDAVGFTYVTSDGNSDYNALQVRMTRRFRRGVSFYSLYTFSKAIDDAYTFGSTVAQNPNDISAERGLSSFDQRHKWTTSFVWTSPVGGTNGLMAGKPWLERLLKDWQFSSLLTLATGTPLTARVLGNRANVGGTVGAERAEATGQPLDIGPGFFNPLAFTLPPPGEYGNAGRDTIPGPGTFSLNATFGRSFNLAERKRLEFRLESNNVLNHVNYTSVQTVINAVDYALPLAAGSMRTLSAVVRFRF